MAKYGFALDNLLSAEMVMADASVVRASADENPDLFWAIRGGGGNFGIAASLEYALHPVGPTRQRLSRACRPRQADQARKSPASSGPHCGAPDPALVVYGPNLPRLRALKRNYDPGNFFRQNVNILPQ